MSKSVIVGTDTVYAALITRCNANFTELYNYLSGTGVPTFAVDGWTNISAELGSGWSVYSTYTASYMKDPFGFVHLKGIIASDGSGATALTLPAGYRPSQALVININFCSTYAVSGVYVPVPVIISTGGVFTASCHANGATIQLDSITFKAA